jgi:hypothetical protein
LLLSHRNPTLVVEESGIMKKIILCLVGVSSLWASDTLSLKTAGAQIQDGGFYISPYTGTLTTSAGTNPVTLYCDDFNNESTLGTSWNVNIATVNGNLSTTRFNTSNPADSANPNPNYPIGTQLYEEEAWLFTQEAANSGNTNVMKAIQEAAWHLTSASTSQPSNYNYQAWITAAASDYNKTVAGYVTADYSQWYVLTQVGYAGNTTSAGNQEFLAYIPGSTVQQAPEPGTLLLAGAGLLLAGASRRIARIRKDS